MNYKSTNIERDTKLIKRYLDISKPSGVKDIKFKLRPTGDKDEYYMSITYILPDGSEYLNLSKEHIRYEWNTQIVKDVRNYFGLLLIISNTSIRNEKFNYGE
jgi:hypothetical protein